MKKSVLSLSITAAVSALGLVGGAQAALTFNGDGVGHMLLVPYYTAQAENSTLINLVNTDTINGKAVKVRFRGAANSDDVYDFQVFLSPGDVWTGNVSKGADGRAQLTTNDASCTKPAKAVLNATPFVTSRLDSTLTTDGKANGTREGYVEIFNMADISSSASNPLFTAIKHVNKVAPCTGTAWTDLDVNTQTNLSKPTGTLTANWTIINVVGAAAWSGKAEAIVADTVANDTVYWPQTAAPAVKFAKTITATATEVAYYTADPLLAGGFDAANSSVKARSIIAGNYDLPDMSTPYDVAISSAAEPVAQANALTAAIAATAAANEFLTDSSITASTDWVFSQPTRRYHTALDYAATGTDDGRRFSEINGAYYAAANTLVTARQICVKVGAPVPTDREESLLSSSTEVVVSPSTPADPLSFCGETTVLSINNGAATTTTALKANVAVKDLDVTYVDGWMTLPTPGNKAAAGLPVLGSAFFKANAGANSFGAAFPHRVVRPVVPVL